MRYNYKKIIPGIVLAALILSIVPIGAPVAHAQEGVIPTNPDGSYSYTANAAKPSTQLSCSAGITQCLAQIMYYIGPGIAGFVAYVGAYFFSIVIQLSLNSTAYALQFLTDGWSTVRDIANMAFIFILIYIAMTVMLQAETAGTIKTLAVVVVIALLVNFSFFFTRVAIDAGNILALQFYNAIPAGVGEDGKAIKINGVKDLSAALMGASSPQVLLSSKMFDDATKASKDSTWGALGIFTVIYLSVAAMLWMLFFAFIQVGIKFMLRIVGLWFVLIASPLAFVARTMPKTKTYFDQWLQKLIEYSLYPAIFLFMFLILTQFADSMTKGTGGKGLFNAISNAFEGGRNIESTDAMGVIASVAIRMGFILALMYVALHVSEWLVKEGSAIATKISSFSGKAAFGSAGLAARWTVGSGSALLAKNSRLASSQNWAAQGLWRSARFLSKRSYDARALPGVKAGLGLGGIDVGEAKGKGGYKATEEQVVKWFGDIKDQREADRRDLQNKRYIKNLPGLEKEFDADELKTLRKEEETAKSLGMAMMPDRLAKKNVLEEKGAEIDKIKERIQNFNKREMESLSAKDITNIAHVMKESQVKTIKDSTKWTDSEKETVHERYHETNQDAPLLVAKKQMETLQKISKTLLAAGVSLNKIGDYTDPAKHHTINSGVVDEMKEELKDVLSQQQSRVRDPSLTPIEKTKAAKIVLTLQQEVKEAVTKLGDNRKNIPAKMGNRAAAGEFEL